MQIIFFGSNHSHTDVKLLEQSSRGISLQNCLFPVLLSLRNAPPPSSTLLFCLLSEFPPDPPSEPPALSSPESLVPPDVEIYSSFEFDCPSASIPEKVWFASLILHELFLFLNELEIKSSSGL